MHPPKQEPAGHFSLRSLGRACRELWSPLLATAALAVLVTAPGSVAAQMEIEGEYGLRVTEADGDIGIGWLTSDVAPGALTVLADGEVLSAFATPAAGAHYVSFPKPTGDVELRYGTAGAESYRTTLYLNDAAPPESGELTEIDSLFVVGDVHGEYDRLRQLLENGGLVDADARWTGGERHVVFLGDLFDRGDDVTRTLWFLYRLEREAGEAGGGAHVVLGNHETMIFTEDLRYVAPKEQLIARLHGVSYTEMFDIRGTVLGRWLAGRPGLMRIDSALLAHGGVVPEIEPHAVAAINDSMRTYLAEDLFYRWADPTVALVNDSETAGAVREDYAEVIVMDSASVARRMALIFDERSILWYRGYIQSDTLGPALDRVLENFGVAVHIVGHTPVPSVGSRYDGRLVGVDLEEAASEMLLLTKDAAGGYQRWRIELSGPPELIQ